MKKALIQLHVAVFLAGFTAILGKLINLNEGLLVWYRLLITVVTLGALMFLKKEFERLPLKSTMGIFLVGSIVALLWDCFYGGIKYSNVYVSLSSISAMRFLTSIFEPLFFK